MNTTTPTSGASPAPSQPTSNSSVPLTQKQKWALERAEAADRAKNGLSSSPSSSSSSPSASSPPSSSSSPSCSSPSAPAPTSQALSPNRPLVPSLPVINHLFTQHRESKRGLSDGNRLGGDGLLGRLPGVRERWVLPSCMVSLFFDPRKESRLTNAKGSMR